MHLRRKLPYAKLQKRIYLNYRISPRSASLLSVSVFASNQPRGPLMITQRVSAERLLVTIALLRVYLNFADTERCANVAIAHYATTVGEDLVPGQKDVSLDYLADFWLDESSERWNRQIVKVVLLITAQMKYDKLRAYCSARELGGFRMPRSLRRYRRGRH